ncbi:MAG: HD domain-containing protein [Ferruginibacter sp.]
MYISCTDKELFIFKKIARAAKELGVPAYVVGGFVRDKILGRPTKDIDIVCVGDGIALAQQVAALFNPAPQLSFFKNFGTAQLKFSIAGNELILNDNTPVPSPPERGWGEVSKHANTQNIPVPENDSSDLSESNTPIPSAPESGWGEVSKHANTQNIPVPENDSSDLSESNTPVPSPPERGWGEVLKDADTHNASNSGTDAGDPSEANTPVPSPLERGWGEVPSTWYGEIEFVGARKESYRSNSRNPAVENGTLEDDQNRRDFTINAMAISLNDADYGQLLDPFDGLKHLQQKIICTPLQPEKTFSDDPLRMMRAIRFATQLQFQIAPQTFTAIRDNKDRIKIISGERIADELNKILLSPKPSIGFDLLYKSGLLQLIFPQMVALAGAENIDGMGHKDNFYHTLQVVDNIAQTTNDLWLRWAAVLHDIAKPATKRFEEGHGFTFHGHEVVGGRMVPKIFAQLKLPQNEKMRFVKRLVELHLRPISLSKEEITDSAIRRLLFDAGEDFDALMLLCEADITSKNKQKVKRYLENFELVRRRCAEVEEKDSIRNWQPPISGEIIMQTFNLAPSKPVGIIKDAIRNAILDGHIGNDYAAAHAYMLKIAGEMGLKAMDKE